MTHNFRIEPTTIEVGMTMTPKGFIKVFSKTNKDLPVDIDIENRFGIFFAEGEPYLEELHNFKVRKDDVWVLTMPKSGTTWMLELVWLLMNNFDYDTAMKIDQRERCRYLEYVSWHRASNSIEEANNMKSPRVLKSHLPMHMLPKGLWTVKPKIIYVTRDPKDGIVSFYHFLIGLGINSSSKEVFVNEALKDRTLCSPFWSHVAEFWNLRNEPNIYFTSFERMKKDLRSIVVEVIEFLGKTASEEEIQKLLEHLTFDKMKDNASCNNVKEVENIQRRYGIEVKPSRIFIRKGVVGSYKEDLNIDLIERIEDWTRRSLKVYGITPEEILYS